jgi:hypothetical protein
MDLVAIPDGRSEIVFREKRGAGASHAGHWTNIGGPAFRLAKIPAPPWGWNRDFPLAFVFGQTKLGAGAGPVCSTFINPRSCCFLYWSLF